MIKLLNGNLFDLLASGSAKVAVNFCDCFGHIGSPTSIEFRVKYPGSYAVDRMNRTDNPHTVGTVSVSFEQNCTIFNAYLEYNFNGGRFDRPIPVFDLMVLRTCFYQLSEILPLTEHTDIYIAYNSFIRYGISLDDLVEAFEEATMFLPCDVVIVV